MNLEYYPMAASGTPLPATGPAAATASQRPPPENHPLRLLHVQFGPCAETALTKPQSGAVHMFCAPDGDPIWAELSAIGIAPDAAALILHYRMDDTDRSFVLTSDI